MEKSNGFKYNWDEDIITDKSDEKSTTEYYSKWSQDYETDMNTGNLNGPNHLVSSFLDLKLGHQVRILDLCAGTGLVAQLLHPHGYTNIDAIDGSEPMIAIAQKKGLYKNCYVSLLGGSHKAPIEDGTYDVIISSGAFAPGHLYSDAFPDLIRMVKPGGIMIWNMRSTFGKRSPKFAHFDDDVDALVSKDVWHHLVPRKEIDQYVLGSSGYVYVMQKAAEA